MRMASVGLAAMAASLLCAGTAAGELNGREIAFIDANRVLNEFHKTRLAEAEINRQKDEFKTELGAMQQKLEGMMKSFEAAREESRNPALNEETSAKKLEEAENKLADLKEQEREMRQYVETTRKQLIAQSIRMRSRLRAEIRSVVKDYARKEGLVLVLDSSGKSDEEQDQESAVFYGDIGVDITDKIILLLNGSEGSPSQGKDQKNKSESE